MELRGTPEEQKEQLRAFSRTYFDQFRTTELGEMRQVIRTHFRTDL